MSHGGIPSLNLRKVRGDDEPFNSTLSPAEVGSTPVDPNEEYDGEESYRDYSNMETPHTGRLDASELLGCSVFEITDVPTLQAKLIEAQRLFQALEQRYDRALDAKERQLSQILRAQYAAQQASPQPPPTTQALHSQRSNGSRTPHSYRGGGGFSNSSFANYHETASSKMRAAVTNDKRREAVSARTPSYRDTVTPRTGNPNWWAKEPLTPGRTPRTPGSREVSRTTTPTTNGIPKRYQPAARKPGVQPRALTPRY